MADAGRGYISPQESKLLEEKAASLDLEHVPSRALMVTADAKDTKIRHSITGKQHAMEATDPFLVNQKWWSVVDQQNATLRSKTLPAINPSSASTQQSQTATTNGRPSAWKKYGIRKVYSELTQKKQKQAKRANRQQAAQQVSHLNHLADTDARHRVLNLPVAINAGTATFEPTDIATAKTGTGTGRVKKFVERKQKAHDKTVHEFRIESRKVHKLIAERMDALSENFRTVIKQQMHSIELELFRLTEERMSSLSSDDMQQIWNGMVQTFDERKQAVAQFCQDLHNIENDRKHNMEELTHATIDNLIHIAHMLPAAIEALIQDEVTHLNVHISHNHASITALQAQLDEIERVLFATKEEEFTGLKLRWKDIRSEDRVHATELQLQEPQFSEPEHRTTAAHTVGTRARNNRKDAMQHVATFLAGVGTSTAVVKAVTTPRALTEEEKNDVIGSFFPEFVEASEEEKEAQRAAELRARTVECGIIEWCPSDAQQFEISVKSVVQNTQNAIADTMAQLEQAEADTQISREQVRDTLVQVLETINAHADCPDDDAFRTYVDEVVSKYCTTAIDDQWQTGVRLQKRMKQFITQTESDFFSRIGVLVAKSHITATRWEQMKQSVKDVHVAIADEFAALEQEDFARVAALESELNQLQDDLRKAPSEQAMTVIVENISGILGAGGRLEQHYRAYHESAQSIADCYEPRIAKCFFDAETVIAKEMGLVVQRDAPDVPELISLPELKTETDESGSDNDSGDDGDAEPNADNKTSADENEAEPESEPESESEHESVEIAGELYTKHQDLIKLMEDHAAKLLSEYSVSVPEPETEPEQSSSTGSADADADSKDAAEDEASTPADTASKDKDKDKDKDKAKGSKAKKAAKPKKKSKAELAKEAKEAEEQRLRLEQEEKEKAERDALEMEAMSKVFDLPPAPTAMLLQALCDMREALFTAIRVQLRQQLEKVRENCDTYKLERDGLLDVRLRKLRPRLSQLDESTYNVRLSELKSNWKRWQRHEARIESIKEQGVAKLQPMADALRQAMEKYASQQEQFREQVLQCETTTKLHRIFKTSKDEHKANKEELSAANKALLKFLTACCKKADKAKAHFLKTCASRVFESGLTPPASVAGGTVSTNSSTSPHPQLDEKSASGASILHTLSQHGSATSRMNRPDSPSSVGGASSVISGLTMSSMASSQASDTPGGATRKVYHPDEVAFYENCSNEAHEGFIEWKNRQQAELDAIRTQLADCLDIEPFKKLYRRQLDEINLCNGTGVLYGAPKRTFAAAMRFEYLWCQSQDEWIRKAVETLENLADGKDSLISQESTDRRGPPPKNQPNHVLALELLDGLRKSMPVYGTYLDCFSDEAQESSLLESIVAPLSEELQHMVVHDPLSNTTIPIAFAEQLDEICNNMKSSDSSFSDEPSEDDKCSDDGKPRDMSFTPRTLTRKDSLANTLANMLTMKLQEFTTNMIDVIEKRHKVRDEEDKAEAAAESAASSLRIAVNSNSAGGKSAAKVTKKSSVAADKKSSSKSKSKSSASSSVPGDGLPPPLVDYVHAEQQKGSRKIDQFAQQFRGFVDRLQHVLPRLPAQIFGSIVADWEKAADALNLETRRSFEHLYAELVDRRSRYRSFLRPILAHDSDLIDAAESKEAARAEHTQTSIEWLRSSIAHVFDSSASSFVDHITAIAAVTVFTFDRMLTAADLVPLHDATAASEDQKQEAGSNTSKSTGKSKDKKKSGKKSKSEPSDPLTGTGLVRGGSVASELPGCSIEAVMSCAKSIIEAKFPWTPETPDIDDATATEEADAKSKGKGKAKAKAKGKAKGKAKTNDSGDDTDDAQAKSTPSLVCLNTSSNQEVASCRDSSIGSFGKFCHNHTHKAVLDLQRLATEEDRFRKVFCDELQRLRSEAE
jgi:Domain of unknown function (DUF4455)/Domain of unknown function (DUF4456)